MPLKVRNVKVEIQLEHGTFREGYNTKIITGNSNGEGNSMRINIQKAGGFARDQVSAYIYGMEKDDESVLSTLAYKPLEVKRNRITISAGYDGEYTQYFSGQIMTGVALYEDPSAPFNIEATASYFAGIDVAPHCNNKGTVSIPELLKNIATTAGFQFHNNGVTGNTENYIAYGSAIEQIQNICNDYSISYRIDNNTLSISPENAYIDNTLVILNADSGLLSYPKVDQDGVSFRARFDPNIKWGNKVRIQSIVPKASGDWIIYKLSASLETMHEKWEIEAKGGLYALGF